MIKSFIILNCVFVLIGCLNLKKGAESSEHSTVESEKIVILKSLSSYIKSHDEYTYDFLHDKITLPQNFDTLTYTTRDGIKIFISDTIRTKSIIYYKKLDSLVNYSLFTENITIDDIMHYYGKPNEIGKRSDSSISDLFYWFNTKRNPDCYDPKNWRLGHSVCSLLTFEFDENRILKGIDLTFFWP